MPCKGGYSDKKGKIIKLGEKERKRERKRERDRERKREREGDLYALHKLQLSLNCTSYLHIYIWLLYI
jgi:hypothetical protein